MSRVSITRKWRLYDAAQTVDGSTAFTGEKLLHSWSIAKPEVRSPCFCYESALL